MSKLKSSLESYGISSVFDPIKKEWFFAVNDLMYVLVQTTDSFEYVKKLRKRNPALAQNWSKITVPLKIPDKFNWQSALCVNAYGLVYIMSFMHSVKMKLLNQFLKDLNIKSQKGLRKIKFSYEQYFALLLLLNEPEFWHQKRRAILEFNEKLSDEQKLSDVEIIFFLLEPNDLKVKGKSKP